MASRDLKIAFDKVNIATQKKIDKTLNPVFMNKVGKKLAEDITRRTRTGHGVKKEGEKKEKLDKLKASTIKKRKREKKLGKLSNLTTPTKSNLTMSGELLDSLTPKSIKKKEVRLEFLGRHKNARIKNSDLADAMEKGDRSRNRPPRPFLGPTNLEKKRVIENIVDKLEKAFS